MNPPVSLPRPHITLPKPSLEPVRRVRRAWGREVARVLAGIDAQRKLEQSTRSVLDALAPEWAELREDAFLVDGVWTRTLHFRPCAPPERVTPPGWLSALLYETGGDVSVALHVSPIPDKKAESIASDQVVMKTAESLERQAQGYVVKVRDEAAIGSAADVQTRMVMEGERLFAVGAAVTLRAADAASLDALEAEVRALLDDHRIRPYGMRYRHGDGFRSAGVPYATDRLGVRTTLDTTTLTRCFPWLTNPVGTPTGPLWGISRDDYAPLHFDPWSDNPKDGKPGSPAAHVVMIAPTGSGKTVCTGTLLLRYLTSEDAPDIILIDPVKGDYRSMVDFVGGRIVRMTTEPEYVINPFDLPPAAVVSGTGHVSQRNPVLDQARLAVGLIALLVKDEGERMTKDERTAADTAILAAYLAKGIDARDKDTWTTDRPRMPLLADVRDELERMGKDGDPEAAGLARGLRRYTTGSLAGMFDRHTNLPLGARVTSFDLEEIDAELRQLAVWIIGNFVWKLAKADRQKRIFNMDEVASLLVHEESALLVAELYTLGRAYNLSVWSATQYTGDYTRTHEGRRALDNAHTKLLLHQTKGALQAAEHLGLTPTEAAYLEHCGRGSGLLLTQRGNVRLSVTPSPLELSLMGGKREPVVQEPNTAAE